MSWFSRFFGAGVGGVGSAVEKVAGVFVENREAGAQRTHEAHMGAQGQFAAEFGGRGPFNQLMDGINRIPRPAIALGTLYFFYLAMYEPLRFQEAMVGLALVPDYMWVILGTIITFYFGGRLLHYNRKMRHAPTLTQVQSVVAQQKAIRELRADTPGVASDDAPEAQMELLAETKNPAVEDWRKAA